MLTDEYIKAHSVKNTSRGCYSICPSCSGHNLWYTEDNGIYYCFNCGFTGSTGKINPKNEIRNKYLLPIQKIQEIYTIMAKHYRLNLSPEHRVYLHNRGFDDATIDEFMLGTCISRSNYYETHAAKAAGLVYPDSASPVLLDRITIPYIDGDIVTDIRGRGFCDPKYKSLLYPSSERGAVDAFNQKAAMSMAKEYVIITEGEFKAIAAHKAGFPTIALPGMTSWRTGIVIPDTITPIAVFDSSDSGELSVRQAIQRLVSFVPNLHVTKLPLLGNKKMDIDKLLLEKNGEKIFRRLVEGAVPAKVFFRLQSF